MYMSLIDYWNKQQNDTTLLGQLHNVLKAEFITKHEVQAVEFISLLPASFQTQTHMLMHTEFSVGVLEGLQQWEGIDWTCFRDRSSLNNLRLDWGFGFQSSWLFRSLLLIFIHSSLLTCLLLATVREKILDLMDLWSDPVQLFLWLVVHCAGSRWCNFTDCWLVPDWSLRCSLFPPCKSEHVLDFGRHIDISFFQGRSD